MANVHFDVDDLVNWNDLDELLAKDIGEIREMLAREDADETFKSFLEKHGWIETDEFDPDDDDDDDFEYNEVDGEDEDDDTEKDEVGHVSTRLSPEEEELAISIANDIDDCKYSFNSIKGLYSTEMVNRIEELLD